MIKKLTDKIMKVFSCSHENKRLVSSIPKYSGQYKLAGWDNTYHCPKCGEQINEYQERKV
ncbi:hypothetical protein CCP1ISM_20029 [Azospirillaceae bacterium]